MVNELLKKWLSNYEEGKEVETVEMGGLGNAYEQPIQHLAIEALKKLSDIEVPEDRLDFVGLVNSKIEESVNNINKIHGFSGAQVGASKNIAAVFWRHTPNSGIEKMRTIDPSRIIIIKKVNETPVVTENHD